ncbi:MAG: DsrE family protein [Xanthomonadales bacterium]|nr:DsrE family protein [Xanthomonadales bacterium]
MRLLAFILLVIGAPAWASCALEGKILDSLPNMSCHTPNLVASGRLGAADIDRLKQAGVRLVIDLSEDSETPDFDEGAAVRAAGIEYRSLPIDGAAGLTSGHVDELDRLIAEAGNKPTLIHCASSNRVGALMALRAARLQGRSPAAAIEIGKAWGLKSLEPVVTRQLASREAGSRTPTAPPSADARPALAYPRIAMAGGVYALPASVKMPAADREYRLVIDAKSDEVNDAGLNRRLEIAARALNLYALAGVPADKIKLVVVVHGKATAAVLADASYQKKFGKPNPDAGLIAALHEAGVRISLCGQAMVHADYTIADVRNDVRVELSAMTTLADLQADGYSLIP